MTSLSKPNRRELLKTGAIVVYFAMVAPGLGAPQSKKTVAPDEVDAFLAIDRDGAVIVYSGKVDLGTGVSTALTQIVAEELDVPMRRITVIQGDTALTPDQGVTYGSLSIQNGGMQLRQAAATARLALLRKAAQRFGEPAVNLVVNDGTIRSKSGKSVTYGQLVRGQNFSLKLDKTAPAKDPARHWMVGTAAHRIDIPDKVTGRFTYMQDFRVANMLHGRVVRPPAIGAALMSVDESWVRGIPGVVKVVRLGNFLGVVAGTEWAAITAARQLKASWSKWEGLPDQDKLWDYVRATNVIKQETTSDVGDAPAALAGATRRLDSTYDFAIHTHGSIGPSCAIAAFEGGKLTCWSASQATHNLRKQLALMLSSPEADVRCIYLEGAGCYGRNGHEDAAADATLLARAVGRPVRVQWMRADEHGWDPKGPPTLIDLHAGIDANGEVQAWHSEFFVPQGAAGNVELTAAALADLPRDTALQPGGIIQDSAIQYAFPNVRTVMHRLETTPFRPSWIRSPGRMQNTFANESFIDELAAATNTDPIEFRLHHLSDPRAAELLQRLARLSGWEKRERPSHDVAAATAGRGLAPTATGRGLAYVKYELVRTYVGGVADVEVDRGSGEIRVKRFYVAHDCGQIINPDGVRNQIEGNVLQTISRALMEEVTFDRSQVTSLDWASYPILTFSQVPDIEIDLIDRPDEVPWGAGEPTAAIVAPAISNAVFDATGARLRSVPFKPDKVKAAIGGV
jgi:CO/xanthine dehydrogenase Mo-binding subunit